jgi:hypothetical protein
MILKPPQINAINLSHAKQGITVAFVVQFPGGANPGPNATM